MPVYTFSTKTKRPKDTESIDRIKAHCERTGLNFSYLMVELCKKWEQEVLDGRPTKV